MTVILILSLCACSQTQPKNTDNSSNTKSNAASQTNASNDDTVVVPNVVGMNVDEAAEKLQKMGLTVEKVDVGSQWKDPNATELGYVPYGEILKQNIKEGTVMAKGSTVSIEYTSDTCQVFCENINNQTIIVSISSIGLRDGKIKIPQEYNNQKINKLLFSALLPLKNEPNLREVLIPNSIEIIEESNVSLGFSIVRY